MRSVSALKCQKIDSPKTPGGISKSLLTPCRRVGLSRNWRKGGVSPFQSPISSSSEVKQEVLTRKRKESSDDIVATPDIGDDCETSSELAQTPTRNVEMPRRKKSKSLLTAINKSCENNGLVKHAKEIITNSCEDNDDEFLCKDTESEKVKEMNTEVLSTPVKTKISKKNMSSTNSTNKISNTNIKENIIVSNTKKEEINHKNSTESSQTQKKSPNNLTKECIVVIQKKIFKKELKNKQKTHVIGQDQIQGKDKEIESQVLFDSDSDDIPLVQLNQEIPIVVNKDEDDLTSKCNVNRLHKLSKTKSQKLTQSKINSKVVNIEINTPPISQNSDEDDDFVDKKKTILIRKSYDKVTRPQKAKSTGSITQKDIDELKARIETKKKMLLARAMTEDTKELKDLIKKWQRGCQDALMELMDLMKNKFPDKQNMDYSEILATLKIPPSLVGYDSDNECFLTPNDEDVVLAKFKN